MPEFVSASFRHQLSQRFGVVREIEERRSGRPLLTHEEERCRWRTQKQHGGRPIGRQLDLMVQPFAQGAIADLIMVLNTEHESSRGDAAGIRAAMFLEITGVLPREMPPLV